MASVRAQDSTLTTFPVRVALLGQPRVISADGTQDFLLPRKTLNVLAYLILQRKRPATRDSVAFALFPDDDEDTARGHLRRNLSYLLSSLPPTSEDARFVLTEADRIAWNPKAPALIDMLAFESAIADGRDDEAIGEYAGDLLPTLYDEWTTRERERLRDIFLEALARVIARDRSLRRFDLAAAAAHRLLESDPWREDIVRQLISVRYESGDRAGALSEFELFATRLRSEMNVEPMLETLALRDAVLRGSRLASSDQAPTALLTSASENLVLPFVGRSEAMETALDAWHTAADGKATMLFLSGQAGIGKSRFATELARAVEREGGIVVRGETNAFNEHRPYEVFINALANAGPLRGKPSRENQNVWQRVLDELMDEDAQATFVDDRSARVRLFDSVRRGIADLSRSRPTMMILEDLHWAGSATVDMLEFVATRLAKARVLLVVTCRNDEMARAHPLRSLQRQLRTNGNTWDLTLGLLSASDAQRAVYAIAPKSVHEMIDKAVVWAAGVPLLLHEAFLDVNQGRDVGHDSISRLFDSRFAQLSEHAQTALMYGAIVGARFDVPTLGAVLGWDDEALVDALGESIELALIRATSNTPGLLFEFTHHLVQSAALERSTSRDKQIAHALVARALASMPERSGASSAEIARHFEAGNNPKKAAILFLKAARYALDVFANEETCEMVTSGLRLAKSAHGEGRELRIDLLTIREIAYARLGRVFDRRVDALALCDLLSGDPLRQVHAIECAFDAHRDDMILRHEMLEKLKNLSDVSHRCAAIFERSMCANALIETNFIVARESALRATKLFELACDERSAMMSRLQYLHAAGRLLDYGEVSDEIARIRPVCETSDDLELRMHFHRVASAPLTSEHADIELADARKSKEYALRIGDAYNEARASHNIAIHLGRMRDYEGALREHALTLAAYKEIGDETGIADALVNLASVRGFCGDHRGAIELLGELDAKVRERPWVMLRVAVANAVFLLRDQRASDALVCLGEAMNLATDLGNALYTAHVHRLYGEVYSVLDDSANARPHFDDAITGLAHLNQSRLLAETLAVSARLFAWNGEPDQARRQAKAAANLAEKFPVEHFAETAWHLAATYAILRDDDSAQHFAGIAARAFVDEAMHMDADLAQAYSKLPWHRNVIDYLNGKPVLLGFTND